MIFKYSNLKRFFEGIIAIAPVYNFTNVRPGPGVILRHDIDVSVKHAYDVSVLEEELGITSSILFLTTSPLYNLHTIEHIKGLKSMSDRGFDVGLHFDASIYGDVDAVELEKKMRQEKTIIENIIGKEVRTVSLHCPSINGLYPEFKGMNNAYSSTFFDPKFYLSDSRMEFRDKDPYEFIQLSKEHLIQILLHPFHYSVNGDNYRILFQKLLNNYLEMVDNSFRPYNSKYVEDLRGKQLKDIL